MAAREFMAQAFFPAMEDNLTTEEKLQRILDYLYMLEEQYRYILCKLNEAEP